MRRVSLVGLFLVSAVLSGHAFASPGSNAGLSAALDLIRGVDFASMDETRKEQVGKRLDLAWETLMEHPERAKPLIRKALDAETDDHFFVLDLAYLYMGLDPDPEDVEHVTRWLLKADPEGFPPGFFEIAAGMASTRCEPCMPAVLRMLELEELEASIYAHALPVDLMRGMMFTMVSYGDPILPELEARLSSPDCTVRSNAAVAIGLHLPREHPEAIAEMAASDPCERAREGALRSLALADPPALIDLFDARMEAEPGPDLDELMLFVRGLGEAPPRLAVPRLETLSQVEASEVAEARFEYEGSPEEIVAAMTADDYSLLNDARRSVLRRLSDECLHEFYALHAAALMFREAVRTGQD